MKFQNLPYCTIILFSILICLTGCEKEYPWNLKTKDVKALVVDGIITNEYKAQLIRLSFTSRKINEPGSTLSGAKITVSDSLHLYTFNESSDTPGTYYSSPFQAVVGKEYTLTIEYQASFFSATAYMVPITPMDSISLTEDKGLYKYNHISRGDPAMIEVFLDWSSNHAYCSSYGSCQAQETFYILNNVDVSKAFSPDKETIYFPQGTRIIRRKYSLSPEHQAFLRSLLMETEWRGGLFDVQQGNVISNISNGALGFFGACMVLTDSTIVK